MKVLGEVYLYLLWATTARNITTGGIIQPMASLANLADAMLIAGRSSDNAAGAVYSGVAALGKKATWKGSFSNLVYIFKDQEYAKAMTDYILKYPELSGQYKKMFDGIGEIQQVSLVGVRQLLDRVKF